MANNETRQRCVDESAKCLQACEQCASRCCAEGGSEMAECIRACLDCTDTCGMTISWLSRESSRAPQMCDLCAQVCEQCAEECEKFSDREYCRSCAEACRRCAEACRAMAAAPAS